VARSLVIVAVDGRRQLLCDFYAPSLTVPRLGVVKPHARPRAERHADRGTSGTTNVADVGYCGSNGQVAMINAECESGVAMAVPEFQAFMVAALRALSDGDVRHWREVREPVSTELGMTPEDHLDALPSGRTRFDNRIQWAITHLFQAGLFTRPRRGHIQITDRGRQVLAEYPDRVDLRVLSKFEDYRDFRGRSSSRVRSDQTDGGEVNGSTGTPLEVIAEAVRENNEALTTEVLQRVFDEKPAFLESLVLKLLTAMGYGGRAGVAEHLGRSGDGGLDGVVRQDVLGLDRVYVQAKRYAADRPVGRPDIQAFVGALHGVQADRGVFITTSRFSADAEDYVTRIPNRIVLIDGRRLAELMILHNVGVQAESTFVLKRIDEDFFEQI
jgi:restriction system protein